jgi:hypothetical protein
MRKLIAIALIVTVALVACNKTSNNLTPDTGAKKVPKYQKISGSLTIGGMTTDELEIAGVDSYRVRYGPTPVDYYTTAKRTQLILNDILGVYSNPDSVARAMTDWAIQRGWIDANGNLVSNVQFSTAMLAEEPHTGLRQAYTSVYDSIRNGGTGAVFITWALGITNAVPLTNQDDMNRRIGANAVLEGALNYFDGQPEQKPTGSEEVAAADQQGFNAGWDYATVTNGGREVRWEWGEDVRTWQLYKTMGALQLYWAERFAITASAKVM